MRVLLAEDDDLLGDGLKTGLKQEGYTVDWVKDGQSAENALLDNEFDLVVLDLGLPKKAGLDVLKQIRSSGKHLPVLILTARDSVQDRVTGLDSGAEYILVGKWMEVIEEDPPFLFIWNDHFQLIGKGATPDYRFSNKVKVVVDANGNVIIDEDSFEWPCDTVDGGVG